LQDNIGTKWNYSNLGFGLLGHILSCCTGKNYEELIRTQITTPLNMKSTFITLSPEKNLNISIGHNAQLQRTDYWNIPLLEGCGSIKSTANDLLNFLEAFTGSRHTLLDSAMGLMKTVRRPANQFTQALGWWLMFEIGDDCVITHPGATLGFSSAVAYDPKTHVGVVVLSNSTEGDVGSIAWHILRPGMWPWTTKVAARKEISVDSKLLDQYAGKYIGAEGTKVFIKHVAGSIVIITPTTPAEGLNLSAETEHDFFVKGIDIQVRFQTDSSGTVKGLVIHFAGNDYPASRSDQE
jgi:CubicO group peptidase (beta-lactamase class C family)